MALSSEAIDRIREAIGDDDSVLADILQSFVDEVDGLVDRLISSFRSGDEVTARRVAHTLKSSCRDLGDDQTADLCQGIEATGHTGGGLPELAVAELIGRRCAELKSEVAACVDRLNGGPQ